MDRKTICFTRELPHLNKHAALSRWFLASGQIFTKDGCAARILLRFKTTPASNVIWKGKNLSIVAVSERHLRCNGDRIFFGGSVLASCSFRAARHYAVSFDSSLCSLRRVSLDSAMFTFNPLLPYCLCFFEIEIAHSFLFCFWRL